MHARVVTVQVLPGKQEDVLRVIQDSVVPMAEKQAGFLGFLRLADPRTGKAIAITLWDTEADLIASETSGYYQEAQAKTGPYYVFPPFREAFEVAVLAPDDLADVLRAHQRSQAGGSGQGA